MHKTPSKIMLSFLRIFSKTRSFLFCKHLLHLVHHPAKIHHSISQITSLLTGKAASIIHIWTVQLEQITKEVSEEISTHVVQFMVLKDQEM